MATTQQPRQGPRERILDVADELFYAKGIRAVGIEAIIQQAEAAKMSLYSHFGSKDELVVAYLRRRSKHWRRRLHAGLRERGEDPAQRILGVFDVLGEEFASPEFRGCPFINAGAEFSDEEHPARVVASEHRRWLHQLFAQLVAKTGSAEPDELAAQLVMLYDAAMVAACLDGRADAARRARDTAEMLLSAHRVRPPLGDADPSRAGKTRSPLASKTTPGPKRAMSKSSANRSTTN